MPRKNLRPLCGVPLLAWTIRAGREAKLLSEVYVSTDDLEIATEAKRYGAEVIMRPPDMARDDSPIERCLQQVLSELNAQREQGTLPSYPDVVVTLQPTSPIRAEGLIDRAVTMLRDRPSLNSVLTVRPAGVTWWQEYDYGPQGTQWVHQFGVAPIPQSQDWQPHHERFSEDGSVFATRTSALLRTGNRRCSPMAPLVNDWSPDIDEESDLRLAETLLRAREEVPA